MPFEYSHPDNKSKRLLAWLRDDPPLTKTPPPIPTPWNRRNYLFQQISFQLGIRTADGYCLSIRDASRVDGLIRLAQDVEAAKE